jgi:hypothetical protein
MPRYQLLRLLWATEEKHWDGQGREAMKTGQRRKE